MLFSLDKTRKKVIKIIHTSDWHLGRSLYGRKRYAEFARFLEWLHDKILEENADILLICGDIFDTSLPSNTALELYYKFLYKLGFTNCKNIVIIGGNHDSPTLLEAPKHLLQVLKIYVVGQADHENPENNIFLLKNELSELAIVCAVPYLRDRDLRFMAMGEDKNETHLTLQHAMKNHYDQIAQLAQKKQEEIFQEKNIKLPIIATGHLFATGGKTFKDDGVRDLYVGNLLTVGSDIFSDNFDYVALGHLHLPQLVDKKEHIRYSGSPIALGFDETIVQKNIISLEFFENNNEFIKKIVEIKVPIFQELIRISGDLETIKLNISNLKQINSNAWLEIIYTGQEIVPNLSYLLEEMINLSSLAICRIRNNQTLQQIIKTKYLDEQLPELDEKEVFNRCLDAYDVNEKDKEILLTTYNEILNLYYEQDKNKE